MQTADDTLDLADERLVPPLDKGQRLFRLALVAAALLHAALFIEVGRSVPRTIGDPSGRPDAIAVDLVTEADLRSRETVALPPAGAPQEPAAPARQPAPEPAPAAEAVSPSPAKPAEPAPPTPQEQAARDTADKKQQQAALPDFEAARPDLATSPQPAEPAKAPPEPAPRAEAREAPAKPAEKQAPPAKRPPREARLDPTLPDVKNAPPGRSAAASRPPGITRSGENDEFGRAVIRALRETMPPPRGIFGRVTVRLILTPNGDLAEVRVLAPSGTSLDQSVVFATKQTYFPLPPYNATVADRTFLITYVYR